jgi:hypothetical protein
VQRGHDTAEEVHAAIRKRLPYVTVFTHLEPVEDERSFDDLELDASDVALDPGGPEPGA